jgi:acid stress chaperone HdeB
MKVLAPVLLAASLAGLAPASAQVVDLSTIHCKEFFEGPQERISHVVMWLDGYYQNEDDPPVVDFDRMKKKIEAMAAYCANNPTHGIITAADEVMGK